MGVLWKCCGMCCGVFAAQKCCGVKCCGNVEVLWSVLGWKCCGVLLHRSAVECSWLEVLYIGWHEVD